jgi:hypothetical protein
MSKLVNHVLSCLEKTDNLESNLTDEVLNMEGMSGKKTRHFYNNLCSLEKARYLEIGSWKGSSSCSALCNNKLTCLCIDNWSEFGGPKEEFLENFNKYKGTNDAQFLERDCWNIETSSIGRFNIYMYDGDHSEQSQYDALARYYQALDDEFIFLVDDWNYNDVKVGTLRAMVDLKLNILFEKQINTESNDPKNDWHNGIGIFVLEKEKLDQPIYEPSENDVSNYI